MNNSKREKAIKSIAPKKGAIKGGVLGYIAGCYITDSFLGDGAMLFAALIIAVIAGFIYEKINSRKREYFSMIDNHRILSIDEIASSLSVTYEQARTGINKMIKKGFFGNAYIDNMTRAIVLPIDGVDINTEVTTTSKICPSCGATNKVASLGANKCEYCGTSLD